MNDASVYTCDEKKLAWTFLYRSLVQTIFLLYFIMIYMYLLSLFCLIVFAVMHAYA